MKKKPQKGNPHELTLKQHCFPRRSIERFANQDGIVHVWLKEQGKSIPARPEDQVFCARWVWDQRAEDGFMREVEDAYEALAEEIVQGRIVRRLRPGENNAVTEMYALWLVRSKWRGSPLEDQPLENVIGLAHEFSQDEREGLEKIGVAVVGPDFKLKGRHIASGVAQLDFFRLRSGLKQQRWAVLKTVGTEFVVPDVSDQPGSPAHAGAVPRPRGRLPDSGAFEGIRDECSGGSGEREVLLCEVPGKRKRSRTVTIRMSRAAVVVPP